MFSGIPVRVTVWRSVCCQGSNIYLEQAGELMLLLAEKQHAQGSLHCFELAEGALFVEAAPAADISRRITAFQYELVSSKGPGGHMYPYLHPNGGKTEHTALNFTCEISASR